MSCRYLLCSDYLCNKNGTCDVKYKILNCEKNDIYHIYRQNEHEEDLNIEKKTNHGISNFMKDLINDLIYEKDISMPKKISIKLNSKKYIDKRTQDYKVFDVPT